MYRILHGTNQNCYTFDRDMPGVSCSQFKRGGWQGPEGCSRESLLPTSVLVEPEGPATCWFYAGENCDRLGTFPIPMGNYQRSCLSPTNGFRAKSFQCTW
nr:uncharacterized protein CTRU02_15882 [Colletotrichum truncatum]KAF6780548.1 hypothetical protein CTRU02_15882 [Colletotrichum truncatum]